MRLASACTSSRVRWLTPSRPVNARDAVLAEIPRLLASSARVGRFAIRPPRERRSRSTTYCIDERRVGDGHTARRACMPARLLFQRQRDLDQRLGCCREGQPKPATEVSDRPRTQVGRRDGHRIGFMVGPFETVRGNLSLYCYHTGRCRIEEVDEPARFTGPCHLERFRVEGTFEGNSALEDRCL